LTAGLRCAKLVFIWSKPAPGRALVKTVRAYEARMHFSQLLDRVARGEKIMITRHGIPVAMLVPPPAAEWQDVRAAVDRLRELRKGHSLAGLTIRELIEEGRSF
jgi:prevent-host-death family protein